MTNKYQTFQKVLHKRLATMTILTKVTLASLIQVTITDVIVVINHS